MRGRKIEIKTIRYDNVLLGLRAVSFPHLQKIYQKCGGLLQKENMKKKKLPSVASISGPELEGYPHLCSFFSSNFQFTVSI